MTVELRPTATIPVRKGFIVDVLRLQGEAAQAGLWRTCHAFDDVKEMYGRDMSPEYAKGKEKETKHA